MQIIIFLCLSCIPVYTRFKKNCFHNKSTEIHIAQESSKGLTFPVYNDAS